MGGPGRGTQAAEYRAAERRGPRPPPRLDQVAGGAQHAGMNAARVAVSLLVAGAAAATWCTFGRGDARSTPTGGDVAGTDANAASTLPAAAGAPENTRGATPGADALDAQARAPSAPANTAATPWPLDDGTVHLAARWPVAPRSTTSAASATTTELAVPERLAFRALWYLGVDPAAEATWSRAINDPNMPEGVRSDLIVDMIDEGYSDNNHPGVQDLPLILARLQIIERHAPYAIDAVNRAAFAEIYRDLLELYIRIAGAPPKRN
jgi:hypothetical protein